MSSPENIRSFLFVPGDSEKKLAKADTSGADALVLDLEDSVSAPSSAMRRPSWDWRWRPYRPSGGTPQARPGRRLAPRGCGWQP